MISSGDTNKHDYTGVILLTFSFDYYPLLWAFLGQYGETSGNLEKTNSRAEHVTTLSQSNSKS